jgi:guanine deaminase
MCLSVIYWARMDRIYFGNTKDDAAEINFDYTFLYIEIPKDIKDRAIPTAQMLHIESINAFRDWAASNDKIPY